MSKNNTINDEFNYKFEDGICCDEQYEGFYMLCDEEDEYIDQIENIEEIDYIDEDEFDFPGSDYEEPVENPRYGAVCQNFILI